MTHPLVALARKRWAQPCWFWLGWVAWCCLAPWLDPLLWWCGICVAPLALAVAGSGVLHSHLVEQLEGTPTSAQSGVDALALETTRRSLAPALVVGLAGGSTLEALAFLWVASWASYLAQAGRAWSVAEDDLVLRHFLSWPLLLLSALLTGYGSVFGPLLLLLGSRYLALLGLSHADEVRLRWRSYWQARRPRNDGWSLWDLDREGAIVYRQVTRYALPGFLGLLWRHGLALTLCLMLTTAVTSLALTPTTLFTLTFCLVVLQTARTMTAGLSSMVEERDSRTLESLVITLLEPQEWLRDWARLIWVPRMLENLAFAAILTGGAVIAGMNPWRILLCLLVLASMTVSATYLGLWISVVETDRSRAVDRAGFELPARLWLPAVLALMTALAASAGLAPWPALLCLVLARDFRRRALSGLSGEALAVEDLEKRLKVELKHGGSAEAVLEHLFDELDPV